MNRSVSLFLISLLAACSSAPEGRSLLTYRIDIRQGNMVTQEMAAQLKPGQTKDQVRFILGTPLVADMFHADRWDYVYRFRPGSNYDQVEERRLIVFFEKGKLTKVGGDDLANKPVSDVPAKPATRVIDIAPTSDPSN
jgi:outer membrane protein assembly factor BamE